MKLRFPFPQPFGDTVETIKMERRFFREVGIKIHPLPQSKTLQQGRIVARVVSHHQAGRVIEPFDEQTTFIIGGGIHRTSHLFHPMPFQPVCSACEENSSHVRIIHGFEESEETHFLLVKLSIVVIDDPCYSSYDLSSPITQEKSHLGMETEGMVWAKFLKLVFDERRG